MWRAVHVSWTYLQPRWLGHVLYQQLDVALLRDQHVNGLLVSRPPHGVPVHLQRAGRKDRHTYMYRHTGFQTGCLDRLSRQVVR